jgi:hypothetical protein
MKHLLSFTTLITLISLSLIHFSSAAPSDTIEDIIYRLSGATWHALLSQPYQMITCEMKLLIHFNPVIQVDPIDNLLHIDYKSVLDYKNDDLELLKEIKNFEKCQFNSMIRFSKEGSRLHLNLNFNGNGGYYVENVNLIDNSEKGWTIQLRIEEKKTRTQTLLVYLDFEKLRSKEEIQILVDYLNTLKKN